MGPLELEAWSHLSCELSHAEASAIAEAGLVEVRAEPGQGRWRLQADARIGVAVGPGWEVRVRPRLRVPQLLFLLGYVIDPKGWLDERADFDAAEDLFDAVANGFARHALTLVDEGLLRGYVEVEDQLATLRGRIRFADQVARSALPIPIQVTYDEYTADVLENRILKTATQALLRLPRVPDLARRRLLKLRTVLEEVGVEPRPGEIALPEFTRLNERYRPALRLAQLILRSASIRATTGAVASVAFVFDMNRVFEDFLSVALREALEPRGGEVRLQWRSRLDQADRVEIRPDVTWWRAGRPRAVIDAKHKSIGTAGVPNEDAYQMLAYCTALGLGRGYLVYAKDNNDQPLDLAVRNSTCEILVRTLDLETKPEELLAGVADLAEELAA
jgi:5-methylcytosine-specific restriction enzyme subunit McrC